MIYTVRTAYPVLTAKQRNVQAIVLKYLVFLITVVGVEELVAVIYPSCFHTMANGKINAHFNDVMYRNVSDEMWV